MTDGGAVFRGRPGVAPAHTERAFDVSSQRASVLHEMLTATRLVILVMSDRQVSALAARTSDSPRMSDPGTHIKRLFIVRNYQRRK